MTTQTPNMDLTKPDVGPGGTPGPDYATTHNNNYDTLDNHDHSNGKGKRINSAGISIDSDLSFNSYNVTQAKSFKGIDNASPLPASDKLAIYFSGGDFYINNGDGTSVKITDGTGLNLASVGSIGGDYGAPGVTASVSYSDITKTYSFLQASGITAKMAMGDIILTENIIGANPITIKSPASLGSAYTITMPSTSPVANAILKQKSDNSGLEFSTSPIYIDSVNNRVGFKTVTPGADIVGDVTEVRYGNSSGDTLFRLGSTGSAIDTHAVFRYDRSGNFLNILIAGETPDTNGLTIVNGGGIGIQRLNSGTYNLELNSSAGLYNNTGSLRTFLGLEADGGVMVSYDTSSIERIKLRTNGTSFFYGGSLAIGKTTATATLDVNGSFAITGISSFSNTITRFGNGANSYTPTNHDALNFPRAQIISPKSAGAVTDTSILANCAYDGTTLKYITSAPAAILSAYATGDFTLKTFPTGVAGNPLPAGTTNLSGNPTLTTCGTPLNVTGNITATTGNIATSSGNVTASGSITSSGGNIVVSSGGINTESGGIVKFKVITGTTGIADGSVSIAHGLDWTKIAGWTLSIKGPVVGDWAYATYPNGGSCDSTNFYLQANSSASFRNVPFQLVFHYLP